MKNRRHLKLLYRGFTYLTFILCLTGCQKKKLSDAPVKIKTVTYNQRDKRISGVITSLSNDPIKEVAVCIKLSDLEYYQYFYISDLKAKESRQFSDKVTEQYKGPHEAVLAQIKIFNYDSGTQYGPELGQSE